MKTRILKTCVFLVSALIVSASMNAQVAMTRSSFTGTYTPISTATGATTSIAVGDDAVETGVNIGFTFNYLGTNYTQIGFTTNGAAGFVGMTATRFNTDLYTTTAPNNLLAPWWDDLTTGSGSILYQTQGTPGSQTFTIQWTNVNTYYFSSTVTINFQIILYEGTNVIEYTYGTNSGGTYYTGESASIGLKDGTGGNGHYIDAVTGSSYTGNGMLTAATEWPTHFYRFTPGAPTVLAGGTYTVGNAGTYYSISEAVADINHRGISGAVNLQLLDANNDYTVANGRNFFPILLGPVAGSSAANTITIAPTSGTATITSPGEVAGNCVNQSSTTAYGTANEPVLGLVGASYVNISSLNLVAGNNQVDRGLSVINSNGTTGAHDNSFTNIAITLNRTNTSTIAMEQRQPTAASSAAGANSNNVYKNLTISNTYAGINFAGTAAFPDMGVVIGNTSPTVFNSIGSATANDIGNGGSASYGIQVNNLDGVNIYNNEIRNVTVTGSVAADGIIATGLTGNSSIYRNRIHDIKSTSVTSTTNITGIRSNMTNTGIPVTYIYNNFIYGLNSGYTGAASATRQVKGIFVQSLGGGAVTQTYEVSNNNVLIDGSATPNISNTCFEIGTAIGPVMNVRNNNFMNNTGAQTAPAVHYTWVSTAANTTGNIGSISDYNNLYVANTTQGNIGAGAGTPYATLANWQAAMTQDANSLSTDPSYTSSTDLHVNSPSINAAGTTLAWVTDDIDAQARAATPDIGADEFVLATLDAGATVLVTPTSGNCYTSTQSVVVRIKNYAVNPLDFSVNNVTVTCNITGAATATLNFTVSNNALNGNVPLGSGSTIDVPVGTFNMTAAGTYTFNAFTTLSGDGSALNDAMSSVNINFQAGTMSATPPSVCQGSTTTLTLTGNTASTFQWQMSTDGGITWNNIVGGTTSPYVDTPGDTTAYQASVCGVLTTNSVTVIWNPTVAPTTINDTVCGVDTAYLAASGAGTLNWYTVSSGGSPVHTGTTYNVLTSSTTTYYVESVNGGSFSSVGLYDNTAGGAQQTSTAYNTFDVTQNCTLVGAYVYPGAVGNVVCELRNSAGGLIDTRTIAVGAADVNQRTYVALNFLLTPGTGYRLAQGTGSVSMFRNTAGVTYPYTLPGYLSITGSSAGGTFYYFFYNWQVLTGCPSSRTPVVAVEVPAAPVNITASASVLCQGDTTDLSATSTNLGYSYSWTPATSLSSSTGANVQAFPGANMSYIVTADSSGCLAYDTIAITVNTPPSAMMSVSDTVLCVANTDTLVFVDPFASPFTNTTVVNVPDANPVGATSVINIPFSTLINPSMSMQVCFDMTHTWDGDMSFTLISPTGTQLDLCSNNGGSGDNFTSTCFNMSASTNITAGASPFTGSWIPEGAGGLNVYNGETTQGNWTLFMVDGAGGDVGVLYDWSISFNTNNSFQWSSSPAGLSSSADTVMVNPTVSTTYYLTVTDTTTGCQTIYSRNVFVNPPLSLSVSNDTTICSAGTASLNAMGAGGDNNLSYSWSNGPTTASNPVSPASNTMYYVTLSDGCSSPVAMDSVMVSLATPVMITSISNDTTMCSNTAVTLNSAISGGLAPVMYMWSDGGTAASDNSMSGAPSSVTTIYLDVMDACMSASSDTVRITAYGTPSATVMSNDTTICSGDSLVLMGMGMGGDGNISYSWSNGPTTANDTVVTTSTTSYVMTVTDGCGLTANDNVNVTVFGTPSVVASNDTAVCYPNSAYLSSTASGGSGVYTYQWSDGTMNAMDTVTLFGTQMQYITVTDGCGATATDSVLVSVNFQPIASFNQTTIGSTVTFTNTSQYGTSYSWNFGDSQTSTATAPSHTYASNGVYTVTLVVTNSCGSDTATLQLSIDVGINDPAVFAGVNIYPNPTAENFNVSFGMAMGGKVQIELFDVQGKVLQSTELSNITAGTIVPVNVVNYDNGVYFLRMTSDVGVQTYKLSVQH